MNFSPNKKRERQMLESGPARTGGSRPAVDQNAPAAYRRAGYAAKGESASVNARQLLRNAPVSAEIARWAGAANVIDPSCSGKPRCPTAYNAMLRQKSGNEPGVTPMCLTCIPSNCRLGDKNPSARKTKSGCCACRSSHFRSSNLAHHRY